MPVNNTLAIVFPGQGSQSVGMLDALNQDFPEGKKMLGIASEALDYDLEKLIAHGPETELNLTEKTQPALLAAGVITWEYIKNHYDILPAFFAGHSLGEYTALVCAGVITYEDGINLVAERGRCMQHAVPTGAGSMAAILGLEDEIVIELCKQVSADKIVAAANFNSPGQIVIAGHTSAVENVVEKAKQAGAKRALILPVSVPSHCGLMQEAAEQFAQKLDAVSFSDATVPIVQNVDAVARKTANEIKPVLLQQLYQPVQWIQSVQFMSENSISTILECGPGKVLCGLIKRIDRSLTALPVMDSGSLENAVKILEEN